MDSCLSADVSHCNWNYLLFMGWYLGWLRNRSGSLVPGMLVHFTHNLLALLATYYPPFG